MGLVESQTLPLQTSPSHQGGPSAQRLLNIIASRLSIADVGCGTGDWGASLMPKTLTYVDPSPEALVKALRTAAMKGFAASAVSSSADQIALPSESFDVVTSRLALHHMNNVPVALSEMTRLVRFDGYLILCDLEAPETAELRSHQHAIETLHDSTHQRTYALSEIVTCLLQLGLRVETYWSNQFENPSGIALDLWFDSAGTLQRNREQVISRLDELTVEQMRQIGFTAAIDGYRYHANSYLVIARK